MLINKSALNSYFKLNKLNNNFLRIQNFNLKYLNKISSIFKF